MQPNKTRKYTREQMIDFLIKDKFWDWIFARNTDGLINMLEVGFEGYNNLTDKELEENINYVDVEEIIVMTKRGMFKKDDNIPFLT